ncbi:MAG: looped-hinge helix DNA binding domain, AbrB family [halophilic archaeon J07HB67]|jgi:looped-hinge helix DNA binding domain, AbrB family|nr:MAG: looped-hinge helix DNA binding domain, AbrB family [halophilic archaeon J07HB67]
MNDFDARRAQIGADGAVTIPRRIREELGIEEGDIVSWTLDKDSKLSIELRRQRYGAFDDFEPTGGDRTDDSRVLNDS